MVKCIPFFSEVCLARNERNRTCTLYNPNQSKWIKTIEKSLHVCQALSLHPKFWNSWKTRPKVTHSHIRWTGPGSSVECPLRGTGGHWFDPGPRRTKVVKHGTSSSSLGTQGQDQDSLLVRRRNDNHSPGPVIGEISPLLSPETWT